MELRWG